MLQPIKTFWGLILIIQKQKIWDTYLQNYLNLLNFSSHLGMELWSTFFGHINSFPLQQSWIICIITNWWSIILCVYRESSQVLCLIFVDRIITAKVIERFAKKVPQISHFTVSYLTGNTTSVDALAPKQQKEILDSFRSGKVFVYCIVAIKWCTIKLSLKLASQTK